MRQELIWRPPAGPATRQNCITIAPEAELRNICVPSPWPGQEKRHMPCAILGFYGRAGENLLPGNFRLPDERARLGESGGHAYLAGIPPGTDRRRSRLGAVQHL